MLSTNSVKKKKTIMLSYILYLWSYRPVKKQLQLLGFVLVVNT